jgi:uncharacterized protein
MIDPTCWPRSAAVRRPGTSPFTTCTRSIWRAVAMTSSSARSNGSVPLSFASSAAFEFRYDFPGWPRVTRGRANLVALYSVYGNNIRLDRSDALITHPSENGRVVTLEYEVHGKIFATDMPYDNRFVSIATIENRKIVRWRDYMDSLAAWRALNGAT